MMQVMVAIHLIVTVSLVGVILLQRSEGGVLGSGGSGASVMTGRSAGNLLTRITSILAGLFFLTSITLSVLASIDNRTASILDDTKEVSSSPAPVAAPVIPVPPPVPQTPSAPVSY